MPEWLAGFLKNLDIPARIAWTAMLFGVIALLLIRYKIWPFETGEVVSAPVAGFIALFGAVVLFVYAYLWALSKLNLWRETRLKTEKDKIDAAHRQVEVKANLGSLTDQERHQLFWILRRGAKRVDLPIKYTLVDKGVLNTVNPSSFTLVDVNEWVWEHRAEIIGNDRKFGITKDFTGSGRHVV
jgi:hypothetical protein